MSLASFKPAPVISRTALITLILAEPAPVSSTLNDVLASAAPPAAPAAATGAAAETPNSSSIALTRSFKSEIEAPFNVMIMQRLLQTSYQQQP